MKTKRLIGWFNGKPVYKLIDTVDIDQMFEIAGKSGLTITGFTTEMIPLFGIPSHLRHIKP